MRSLVISTVLLALASGQVMAKEYGPAGCGLGTEVVFQDANEWHEHVLAATTNGTSGNQTFGMTSGTLGCETNGPMANGVASFMNKNLESIAADTAQGEGETLSALVELIGVDTADQSAFKTEMQANFDAIFVSENATATTSYTALVAMMKNDARFSKYLQA